MTTAVTNNTANLSSTTASLPGKTLGSTDFLRLMTEQLKQQDPFEAHDNSQMIAQMAQINASTSTTEMSATLKSISTQLGAQSDLLKQIITNTTVAPAPATPAA